MPKFNVRLNWYGEQYEKWCTFASSKQAITSLCVDVAKKLGVSRGKVEHYVQTRPWTVTVKTPLMVNAIGESGTATTGTVVDLPKKGE